MTRKKQKGQLYDKGYKLLFSHPEFIKDFVFSFFAAYAWVRLVDFKKSASLKTDFIRDNLKERRTDILYKLFIRQHQVYLYLLIENQSRHDPDMPLRLLAYMVDFYEYYRKAHPTQKKLPLIIPVVFYRGTARWKTSLHFKERVTLFDHELGRFVPDFTYLLIDTQRFKGEHLQQLATLIKGLFFFEQGKELTATLQNISAILQNETQVQILGNYIAHYITATLDKPVEDVTALVYNVLHTREEPMGLAEVIQQKIDRGFRKGKQQGLLKGKREAARNMLQEGLQVSLIARITGLSEEEIRKLDKQR